MSEQWDKPLNRLQLLALFAFLSSRKYCEFLRDIILKNGTIIAIFANVGLHLTENLISQHNQIKFKESC